MITGHLPELAILLVIALIFFGPKRLPELGGALGNSIRSFKSGLAHFEAEHTDTDSVHDHTVSPQPVLAPVTADAPGVEIPAPVHREHSA